MSSVSRTVSALSLLRAFDAVTRAVRRSKAGGRKIVKKIFEFARENAKIRKSLVFLSVAVIVCCIGVINNKIQNTNSLGVSAGYDDYEAAEMERHNGEVLVDSLNITQMPGSADGSHENGTSSDAPGASADNASATDANKNNTDNVSGSSKSSSSGADNAKKSENKNTALVSSDEASGIENTDEYFREARETLTCDRNEMISMLTDTIETSSDGSQKSSATEQKAKLLEYMETEKSVESLIRNKGFTDAFVLITDRSVNVTVQAETLSDRDAAKILDIVLRETGRSVDDVVIQAKAV